MTTVETSLTAYWALMMIGSVGAVIYRKPVARWRVPHLRCCRDRPDGHRLYERGLILVGTAVATMSLAAFYVTVVVLPKLDSALAQIGSPKAPCEVAERRAI
jgi:hypothetical protein